MRRQFLNEHNGQLMFRSVHFPIHISDIVKEIESGKQCTVDLDAAKIYFQEFPGNINTSEPDESKPENMQNDTIIEKSKADEKECTRDDTLQELFGKTNKLFEETGRGDDFKAVLRALSNGTLNPQNIAVHLLLDIGNLLSSSSFKNVRYSDTTLDFWAVVYKMFRGKATRFFRGTMRAESNQKEGNQIIQLPEIRNKDKKN